MPHLDEEDIELVLKAMEARELARLQLAPKEGRSAGKRLTLVVIVIVALVGADHVIHLEWMVRVGEMSTAAFFDWWFNVAKAGEMKLPKPPKLRRKAKAKATADIE